MATANPEPLGSRVSLRDIALRLGVSHVTVSLALRDDPRISEQRRNEVRKLAQAMGYTPDPMLSSLSAYRQAKKAVSIKATIAWINQWPKPKELRQLKEFDAYWRGAHAYASKLGYRLEEFSAGADMPAPRLQQILTARNVRGILIPPHNFEFKLPEFDWNLFSVVRLGSSVKFPRAHIVTSDQLNCAALAFERMWERGYRRIGYVADVRHDQNTGGNFRAGYLSAQDVHVPLKQHIAPLALPDGDIDANIGLFKQWLQLAKPDALLTSLGNLSSVLTRAKFPMKPALGVATTSLLDGHFDAGVDQNSIEVGRVAMATLAALIHQNERGIPQYCRRVLVEGRWVDGDSLPDIAARLTVK